MASHHPLVRAVHAPHNRGMSTPPKPARTAQNQRAKQPTHLHVADIQGLARLAAQATLGLTALTEKVHGNVYKAVAAPLGVVGDQWVDRTPGASGVRKSGITGLVYGSVKAVTRLAAGTVDAVLSRVAARAGAPSSSPQREAVLSALNGVLGDQLAETSNPLAIAMHLRHAGRPLVLEKAALSARFPRAGGKVLVLVHGLCMNDLQWCSENAEGHLQDHGEALAGALGYTPVYLHYNTGLHTSTNGEALAGLLEQLLKAWPQPVKDLSLLVHSMGGLVARSACHHGKQAGQGWRARLKHLVFLGTPHHGAPLERVGHWVDHLLGSHWVTQPFARIGQIRSAGITDLRHGHVLEADWQGRDRFVRHPDRRTPVPLPDGVACHAVAATLAARRSPAAERLVGDGLVPLHSALGIHDDAKRTLGFAKSRQAVFHRMGHLALLGDAGVAQQLEQWLQPA